LLLVPRRLLLSASRIEPTLSPLRPAGPGLDGRANLHPDARLPGRHAGPRLERPADRRGIIPFPPLPGRRPSAVRGSSGTWPPTSSCWPRSSARSTSASPTGCSASCRSASGSARLSALFLGLGTVLWYTSVIGTTWFWAHVVAVGCADLFSVGLALSVDRSAAEPRPLRETAVAVRRFSWPGRLVVHRRLVALGVIGELLFVLAGAGTPAAALAGVGVLLSLLAALLAVTVAGRPGVLAPIVVLAAAIVGGVPAAILAGAQSPISSPSPTSCLAVAIAALWWFSRRRAGASTRAIDSRAAGLFGPESIQVAAGIMFGLAVTARLTVLFGFPFFVFVGGGRDVAAARSMLAGAGAAVPVVTLLVITYATSGQLFNPAYDYLYQRELVAYGGVQLQLELVDHRHPLHPPEHRDHAVRRCLTSCPHFCARSPFTPASAIPRPARGNAPPADCSTPSCAIAEPAGDRDEHPARLARLPGRPAGLPAGEDPATRSRHGRCGARRRGRRHHQPDAFQPGLGPVRLPVQQRLRSRSR
jgi:hypothetical protein